jgi:succinoglycan biosynthesis transport protein ExoP
MNEPQIISLTPQLDVVYRHRLAFSCMLAIGLCLTACAILILPGLYRSTTMVRIEPPQLTAAVATAPFATQARDRFQALNEDALGRISLGRIIGEFKLYPRKRAAGASIDELADYMRGRIALEPVAAQPRSDEQPVGFSISFEYPVAAIAQQVTARLGAIYVDQDLRERTAAAAAAYEFLREQMATARARLDARSGEIKAYQARYAGALPEEMASNLQQLDRLREELDRTAEMLSAARTASPEIRFKQMQSDLITLRARYSDAYPDVVALRAELDALKASRDQGATRIRGKMEGGAATPSVEGLEARRAALGAEIALVRERIAATPAREQALAALERDYTVLSGHYAQSMNRQLEAQASAALARRHAGGRLRIVDPANLPLRRARPDRLAILLLGALLSVATATALSFALFYTDSSYKDPEELSHAYGSPVLVAIPRVDEEAGRWERQQSALGAAALACVAISMGVGGSVDVYNAAFLNRREGCACNASVRMRGANKMNSAYEALTRTESARGERRRNEQPSDDGRAARDEGAAGGVPPAPRYGAGPALIAGNDRYGAANDRILVLSARLQTLAAERDRHLFAVTSALAGEGKSFVALNLAASLAQNGMRLLLIDMDLRSPSLHWALRLSPPDGLSSYLRERIDFESSMQVTGLAGADIDSGRRRALGARALCLPAHAQVHRGRESGLCARLCRDRLSAGARGPRNADRGAPGRRAGDGHRRQSHAAPRSRAGAGPACRMRDRRPGAEPLRALVFAQGRVRLGRSSGRSTEAARSAEHQVPGLAHVGGRGACVADREANREAILQPRRR